MGRGIIKLPLDQGRRELCWQVGRAAVQGSNVINPIPAIRINRDADFVCTRLWLVLAPFGGTINPANNPELAELSGFLPQDATVQLKYGGAGNLRLSTVPGYSRAMGYTMDPKQAPLIKLGLPSPLLLRANSVLFAEISCPSRSGTAWPGDIYFVAEGYKLFPTEPEPIPRTIEAASYPYWLNANIDLIEPNIANVGSYTEQIATITNDGEGKFLAKGLMIAPKCGTDIGQTVNFLTFLSRCCVNIEDSTSGSRSWVQDSTPGTGIARVPLGIVLGNFCNIPFCTPRLLDENAVVKFRFLFETWQTWPGPFTFPMPCTISMFGSLLPRTTT